MEKSGGLRLNSPIKTVWAAWRGREHYVRVADIYIYICIMQAINNNSNFIYTLDSGSKTSFGSELIKTAIRQAAGLKVHTFINYLYCSNTDRCYNKKWILA